MSALKARLAEIIPSKQEQIKNLRTNHANIPVCEITVGQIIGGLRDVYGMVYDTSKLDKVEGIKFRGYSIPEIEDKLQKVDGGHEPLPEALMWLLLTGEIPTNQQFHDISEEFKTRSKVSEETEKFILNLPERMHPMTQLSMAILHLQPDSVFAKAHVKGANKAKFWETTYEDAMNLVAKMPRLAALIYRSKYKGGRVIPPDSSLDWAANYAHMLGYTEHEVKECIRGYLSIHSDHEGGNVCAHSTQLVGSTLSDAYYSYSAGINGLAGPLHGLAQQEVVRWLLDLQKELNGKNDDAKIAEFANQTLKSGRVIPGYGHAVLRNTDPRYLHQKNFAARYIKGDPLVDLCSQVFKVIPGILKSLGKVKNPWPNVDAHSGVLLYHYGIREFEYYPVVFGVSRVLGCMAGLVWARAFGLPIERPESVTVEWLENFIKGKDQH